MPVRQLPEQVVNRIAAGEVVERPASVVKELVENAIDAGASRIEAAIRYDPNLFRLRIRDDGKGIDAAVLQEGARSGHWGLPGIRERAKQIGAKLALWSESGAGTEVDRADRAALPAAGGG